MKQREKAKVLAAIDGAGNIAPDSVGYFDKIQLQKKVGNAWSVVEMDSEIPKYSDDVVRDFVAKSSVKGLYSFQLKPSSERWSIEIDGPDTIKAGSNTETFTVKKVDADGVDMTDGTEEISLSVSRGSLSAMKINLSSGVATFGLTSVGETVTSVVQAACGSVKVSKQVTFVP